MAEKWQGSCAYADSKMDKGRPGPCTGGLGASELISYGTYHGDLGKEHGDCVTDGSAQAQCIERLWGS